VLQSWRDATVAYYRLGLYDHGLVVGNEVHVVGPGALITFTAGTVASVNGDIIGVTGIIAGADSLAGGSGHLQKGGTQAPFPLVLESMLLDTGDVVYARVYPLREPKPDWGDERFTTRWPVPSGHEIDTPGQHGITVNHLGLNKFHEAGSILIKRGAS
jgi:hypothetical protein